MQSSIYLVVNLAIPGFHRWEEAPVEHKYLSKWHRHLFHIRCKIKVPVNRQFEFIAIKDRLHRHLFNHLGIVPDDDLIGLSPGIHAGHIVLKEGVIDKSSCEGLAEFVALFLKDAYSLDSVEVEVLEDGENGAIFMLQGE